MVIQSTNDNCATREAIEDGSVQDWNFVVFCHMQLDPGIPGDWYEAVKAVHWLVKVKM